MDWVNDFQLFLLDFDGLLVNTELLHYRAYLRMCERRGHDLNWSFEDFTKSAHYDSKQLRVDIYKTLPLLHKEEPNWSTLYTEKKKHYLDILSETEIELMPGVEIFLNALCKHNIKRSVVTHSPKEQVDYIRSQNSILNTVENWITREDYNQSKPHPEPYLTAIERFYEQGDRVIGFEDSPRGIYSLLGTNAQPVLINSNIPAKMQLLIDEKKVVHFPTFEKISKFS
ncbi:MAG: Phosphoglycolate phosphatase [Chlamydiae bacterium]|nr:Phosphoglycolate phosphatase [Chlamydiota bacterium]